MKLIWANQGEFFVLHQWNKKLESDDDAPDPFLRTIDHCSVKKCETSTCDHSYDTIGHTFDIYEVIIKSKGFLHQQVRRMVGLAQVRKNL